MTGDPLVVALSQWHHFDFHLVTDDSIAVALSHYLNPWPAVLGTRLCVHL